MQEQILTKIKPKINEYKLGTEIAKAYGCSPAYVSRVLNGHTKYNYKLIEVALNLLDQYKKNESKALIAQAKRAGVKI